MCPRNYIPVVYWGQIRASELQLSKAKKPMGEDYGISGRILERVR